MSGLVSFASHDNEPSRARRAEISSAVHFEYLCLLLSGVNGMVEVFSWTKFSWVMVMLPSGWFV